jgi:signal peptide peptidase SppA
MRYERILSYVAETPWAIRPEKLAEILGFLRLRAAGDEIPDAKIRAIIAARPQNVGARGAGTIGILPIFGVLVHRGDMLRESSGATSVERLSAQFRDMVSNPDVTEIVLDVNSPGGSVQGISEFSDQVYAARSRKKITAIANAVMASAGFWLGASASEVVATPSAELGAIGVLTAHTNLARALEREGVEVSVISAGKYKGEGSPFEALSPEARAALQDRVNAFYSDFVRSVARGRGISQQAVRDGYGQGRVVGAAQALRLGMIDKIATMDETLARLSASTPRRAGLSAGALDPDLDLRRRRLAFAAMVSRTPATGQGATTADLDWRRRRHRLAEATRR